MKIIRRATGSKYRFLLYDSKTIMSNEIDTWNIWVNNEYMFYDVKLYMRNNRHIIKTGLTFIFLFKKGSV